MTSSNSIEPKNSNAAGHLARTADVWFPLLREALRTEGRFCWRLHGDSMSPTLPGECEIEVVPLSSHVGLGSLIVFVAGETLIAHRLVRRGGTRWVTHGDGRLAPDRSISPEQVLGRVATAYCDGRRCWPGPLSTPVAWLWIGRHYLLQSMHIARRAWKRFAPHAKSE